MTCRFPIKREPPAEGQTETRSGSDTLLALLFFIKHYLSGIPTGADRRHAAADGKAES